MKSNLQDSDGIEIILNSEEYAEIKIKNIMIVIKHNDVGISIDSYDNSNSKLPKHKNEEQIWFDDYE